VAALTFGAPWLPEIFTILTRDVLEWDYTHHHLKETSDVPQARHTRRSGHFIIRFVAAVSPPVRVPRRRDYGCRIDTDRNR